MSRIGHVNVYRSLVGTITGETEKAIRFQIDLTSGECEYPTLRREWFPRSQLSSIHIGSAPGGEDIIMASEWVLGQKGWLDFAGPVGYNPAVSKIVDNQVVPKNSEGKPIDFNALAAKLKTPPAPSRVDMDDDIQF